MLDYFLSKNKMIVVEVLQALLFISKTSGTQTINSIVLIRLSCFVFFFHIQGNIYLLLVVNIKANE